MLEIVEREAIETNAAAVCVQRDAQALLRDQDRKACRVAVREGGSCIRSSRSQHRLWPEENDLGIGNPLGGEARALDTLAGVEADHICVVRCAPSGVVGRSLAAREGGASWFSPKCV